MEDKELLRKYPALEEELGKTFFSDEEEDVHDAAKENRDMNTNRMKVTKRSVSLPGETQNVDRFDITGLTQLEALSIQSALRLSRLELVKQVNESAAQATQTDEGRIIEDLMFLGGELSRVCAIEFELGEQVEL